MSELFVYVHKAYTETIFYTQTHLVFDELRRNGAQVFVGQDFLGASPGPGDQLIVYGNVDFAMPIVNAFAPEKRWLYTVDGDNMAYDRLVNYMRKIGASRVIVTYQNADYLAHLRADGLCHVIMPQCVPEIRPRTEKTGDILISGQMSDSIYPTRTRLSRVLLSSPLKSFTAVLDYPGCDNPTPGRTIYAGAYYERLDEYHMAITCRAGARDRLVAKYAEFGASHVLPIGDAPTYMPKAMSDAMVNVDGMTDQNIIDEVSWLLGHPDELRERSDEFTEVVAQRYLAEPNMKRVVEEIRSK